MRLPRDSLPKPVTARVLACLGGLSRESRCLARVVAELPHDLAAHLLDSLDASPGIERHFPEQVISPEDILMEKETEREQEAARALMMERLQEALATLTPRQASCLHARFWEGKQFKEIAEAEGFTTSAAIVTVRNAIIKLQKYYIKRGWMKPPKEKAICTKTAPPKRNRKKTSAKKS